jgi:metal-responsive CopG/Arc/MetJ family transcriptional regulator
MNMPRMNISLSEDVMQKLKDLAEKEKRPISKQIEYMMEFYLDHKDQ